jgi:ionotropic glutamate receptor NMDA 3A
VSFCLSRNGSLDILIADTPILDYYRATDHGCKLQKIGDAINEDTYAVGMAKGFPLKVRLRKTMTLLTVVTVLFGWWNIQAEG